MPICSRRALICSASEDERSRSSRRGWRRAGFPCLDADALNVQGGSHEGGSRRDAGRVRVGADNFGGSGGSDHGDRGLRGQPDGHRQRLPRHRGQPAAVAPLFRGSRLQRPALRRAAGGAPRDLGAHAEPGRRDELRLLRRGDEPLGPVEGRHSQHRDSSRALSVWRAHADPRHPLRPLRRSERLPLWRRDRPVGAGGEPLGLDLGPGPPRARSGSSCRTSRRWGAPRWRWGRRTRPP